MPFIKICGLQSYEEARLALDCGATALGFLVGLTHRAEDKITDTTARDIVQHLPTETNTVLVTHLLDPNEIAKLATFIGVRTIQVHGDVSVTGVETLGSLVPHLEVLKAVHVTGPEALLQATKYTEVARGLVLDSRTNERLGGTGRTHDWSISRQIVTAVSPTPVYLAGGLNPDNVQQAIECVHPAGVDTNSGVEDTAGQKDKTKMASFIAAARRALCDQL